VAAFLPRGSYSAAKAYVNSFGAWAAGEYRPKGVTVTTLCPGFTKTEFHERMSVRRGSGYLWLEADFLVSECLSDFDKGRAMSVPGRQYKVITAATRMVPTRVTQRFQNIGRK
jgi:short-subunit dehydrogenase